MKFGIGSGEKWIKNLVRVIAYPTHVLKSRPLCSVECLVGVYIPLLAPVINEHSKTSFIRVQLLATLLAVSDSGSALFGPENSIYQIH